MIPCKICLTRSICKNMVRDSINKNKNTLFNDMEKMTNPINELSDFCKIFADYFPYMERYSGHIQYIGAIDEDEWYKRLHIVQSFFFD